MGPAGGGESGGARDTSIARRTAALGLQAGGAQDGGEMKLDTAALAHSRRRPAVAHSRAAPEKKVIRMGMVPWEGTGAVAAGRGGAGRRHRRW